MSPSYVSPPLNPSYTLFAPDFLPGTNLTRLQQSHESTIMSLLAGIETEVWKTYVSLAWMVGRGWSRLEALCDGLGSIGWMDMLDQGRASISTPKGMCMIIIISIATLIIVSLLYINKSTSASKLTDPSTPSSRQLHIPPHLILLRYIHPATSLWPEYYLRAFHRAEKTVTINGNGFEGLNLGIRGLRLSKRVVMKDLGAGEVVLRDEAFREMNDWEGIQWL